MLETRIEELTKAVEALTKAIGGMQAPAEVKIYPNALADGQTAKSADRSVATEKVSSSTVASTGLKVEDLPNEQSQSTPPTSQTSAEESKPVAYSDVAKLVTQIAKADLAKAKAALARLGVKHGKELTEDQWPEAMACLTRVAAGEVDPEASHE